MIQSLNVKKGVKEDVSLGLACKLAARQAASGGTGEGQ
jgi:hypothetical protein